MKKKAKMIRPKFILKLQACFFTLAMKKYNYPEATSLCLTILLNIFELRGHAKISAIPRKSHPSGTARIKKKKKNRKKGATCSHACFQTITARFSSALRGSVPATFLKRKPSVHTLLKRQTSPGFLIWPCRHWAVILLANHTPTPATYEKQ